MLRSTHLAMILGLAAAMAGPSVAAQKDEKAPDETPQGVAEAIRFQRAEDAAAARQARLEGTRERVDNTADRMMPESKAKPQQHTKTASARKVAPPQQH